MRASTVLILTSMASLPAIARDAMPVTQQAALVKQYCVVCHNDTRMVGGMSLEHFDPARPDPTIAGMMVSKLTYGAMGAAGVPLPDQATVSALIDALSEKAVGAEKATGGWSVTSNASPLPPPPPPTITASIEQRAASRVYRLTVSCVKTIDSTSAGRALASHPPEMRLTADRSADGVEASYEVDGIAGGTPIRYGDTLTMPLPARVLTVRNLFPGETVTFGFDGLTADVRRVLSTCLEGETVR